MKHEIKIFPVFLILFLVWPEVSFAHKVSIFAWAEGETVHTQSKFSGGKKVVNGRVEVFDKQGQRLLEGITDEKGEFSFKPPAVTDLKIVLTAGMGHRNSWTISTGELVGGPSKSDGSEPAPSDVEKPVHLSPPPVKNRSSRPTTPRGERAPLSAEEVETIVARQLEKKLAPFARMLAAEQEKGPSASDIFGGIGYILGLVGLGAYIRYRKEDRRP